MILNAKLWEIKFLSSFFLRVFIIVLHFYTVWTKITVGKTPASMKEIRFLSFSLLSDSLKCRTAIEPNQFGSVDNIFYRFLKQQL
jgi:hypothetical protein